MKELVVVAYDQTDTQGVADSVVKYLRRDHGYDVRVVGPGHGRSFDALDAEELAGARFFLELDAISGVPHHTEGLERLACPKLAWLVDSHKKPQLHQRIAGDFDLVFFTMAAWAGLFGERGRWLPVHYDVEWVGPREGVVPTHDVGFVGSQPRERTRVLQEIAARHGLSLLLETTTGPREKELTADLYARCKVVFNAHVANDLNFRMVEALACRRLLVTDAQRNGQYELFRDREHLVYYKDDQDLEALLLHYLRHDEERERIAAAGHELVRSQHTTAARVRELVAAAETLVRVGGGPPRAGRGRGRGFLALTRDAQAARHWIGALGACAELDVVTLVPPELAVRARIHVAGGPPPPRLGEPAADALLECLALVDGAQWLLETGLEPEALVASGPEVEAARLFGRPVLEPAGALASVGAAVPRASLAPPTVRPRGTDRPDVSILLVACGRPDVLEATLESTRASLVGSSLSVEWLAFDNGSGPDVRRILDTGLDLVLHAGANRGLAPALDALLREARGHYLLTLEDDWECLSASHGWLELAVAILDTQPDVGVVRLRRVHDGQIAHAGNHHPEVTLRHEPWSFDPLPDVVETRELEGGSFYVAAAEWANWTHNPTLVRREVKDWLGPVSAYLPDPRDHRPNDEHPGLEGAIDRRWRAGSWKVAQLVEGPYTHIGDVSARLAVEA